MSRRTFEKFTDLEIYLLRATGLLLLLLTVAKLFWIEISGFFGG
jgi:hypothetical protein